MIRRAEIDDIGEIMKIWLAANIQAHNFIDETYWREHYRAVEEEMPKAEVYTAVEGNLIQGFIGLTGDYIAGIFVKEEAQSSGIGGQLLEYVKQKHSRLTLYVYRKNKRAEVFYQRAGFQIVDSLTEQETGEAELLMQWEKIQE